MVNNHGLMIHKLGYKKGRRDMIMIYIYRKNHIVTPKKRGCKCIQSWIFRSRKRLSSAKIIITTLQREEKP